MNIKGLMAQYRLLSPELSEDELLHLALEELRVRADVDKNFSKYDQERVEPLKKVPDIKHRKPYQSSANTRQKIKVMDHTGRVFYSRAEMCEYWGITPSLFHCRLAKHWDLKRILTQKKRPRRSDEQIREDLIKQIAEEENENV